MDERQSFERWIKQLRVQLGMTQEALAAQVGCAVQTIRAFEIGRRRPSRVMAERLANVLGVPGNERAVFIRVARGGDEVQVEGEIQRDSSPGTPADSASALILTKLYRPNITAGVVARPRLADKIRAGVGGPLTLVAAPAGFGKTTLVAQQLAALSHVSAWLSLDADDNDPATFVRYLVAALDSVSNVVSTATCALVQSAVTQPETVIRVLINDLAALPHDLVVALDDYHLITNPSIHAALILLLEHLPPRVHLVIMTRADPPFPLAKLRVRRQLVEIRAADLRFTPEETTAFLHDQTGLALKPADVVLLSERTEGWIAGLHLAALSLQQHGPTGASDFVAAFSGSNRFVVDYLVDEVIAQLPSHIQTFVLSTSILERLCAPLCDAVLGLALSGTPAGSTDSSYSTIILADLERLNLFLLPLDDQRRWYRYHHLFADVVQQRLSTGASTSEVVALHERASAWYAGQGLIQEAVYHAIRAAAWPRAVHLIEQHGLLLMLRGHVHTVLSWLQMLPATLLETHPFLHVIHAAAFLFTNQLAAAEARLQEVEQLVPADATDAQWQVVMGTAKFVRGNIARFQGDLPLFMSLTHEALTMLPAGATLQRGIARLSLLASEHIVKGDVTPANEQTFLEALATVGQSGGLSAILRGRVVLAGMQRLQGRLRQAMESYRVAADMLSDPQVVAGLVDSAAYYVGLGDLLRERNDLDAAEQCLTEGRNVALGTMITSADVVTLGYIALAGVTVARGDQEGAHALLDELLHLGRKRSFADTVIGRGRAARARLALSGGDLTAARSWAAASGLHLNDDVVFLHEYEYLTLARVAIAHGRDTTEADGLTAVLQLLGRWHDLATAKERWGTVIETLILQALAYSALRDEQAALTVLNRAVELAAPEGYIRLFADEGAPLYVLIQKIKPEGAGTIAHHDTLLAAFRVSQQHPIGSGRRDADEVSHSPASSVVPTLIEPLTEREREVLRLLADGASNQAIADSLVISLATAKKHVNNIFGKLHAQNRTEAVARAREAHVLP